MIFEYSKIKPEIITRADFLRYLHGHTDRTLTTDDMNQDQESL